PFCGCSSLSLSSSFLKRSRSSARSIASGEVPRIGTFAFSSGSASLSGVFPRERLEIEPVGGVVVGRHCLRVAVDHDGLVAGLLEREGGVAAAVVELDALTDAVRSAAENDDFLLIRRRGFVDDRSGKRRLVG